MKIVIPEYMLPEPVAKLRAAHQVVYDDTLVNDPNRLMTQVRDAHCIIIRNRTQVRGELLSAMRHCKIVARQGVGLDNIDVATCNERKIIIVPATGANARSVAEYVVTTAMMLLRRGAYEASAEVAAGRWPRAGFMQGNEAFGRTIGIVGFGSIGRTTGRLAHALGMQVLAAATGSTAQPTDFAYRSLPLEQLLKISDVVSLHMPLTATSRGMFNAARIAQMKRGAILINTARGGIVAASALAEALRAGHLSGAALDVFDQEPLPAESVFANVPNLLLTTHIAGVTTDSEVRVSDMIAARVLELLNA